MRKPKTLKVSSKAPEPIDVRKIELELCPLCGGEAQAFIVGTWGQIKCGPCNLRLESSAGVEIAAVMWNTRSNPLCLENSSISSGSHSALPL